MVYVAYVHGCNKFSPRIVAISTTKEELERKVCKLAKNDKFSEFTKQYVSDSISEDEDEDEHDLDFGPDCFYDGSGQVLQYTLDEDAYTKIVGGTPFSCCGCYLTVFNETEPDVDVMEKAIRSFTG